jgi:hypothetical protein
MATGPGLAMKMTADTVGISRGVTRTEKLLGELSKSTRQATSAMRGLVAIEVGRLLAGGLKSASNAIGGFVSSVRATAGEIGKLAQVSNASVNEFQRIAFAAQTVGIEQDKMADILKDVNDRVGDFIQTGGGPMADFFENIAPKIGVTAEQFARLSGPEALQLYVDSLEKAGLSQQEMTFFLEAMASDTTALIPLLQKGGAAMNVLADRAERLGVVLSEDQTSAIKQMNGALSQVQATFEGIIGQVTANLAPAVTQMTEQFLSFVAEFDKFGGGGTGIANAITDGLLKFGVVLSQIFDKAIAGFNSFADNLDDNVASFSSSINIFSSITNALKVVFLSFQNFGLFLRRVAANITRLFGGDAESIADIVERQAQTRAQIDAALAGIGGAGQRVLEGGGLRAEGEGAGPIEQVVLDLIERRQKALAEGVGEAVEQSENIFATAAATQIKSFTNKAVSATKTLFGDISDNVQKAFEETRKRNEAIADLNKRYAEESEQIEQERVDALIRTTNQALEVADIRSGGIGQFISLAVGREDPAIAEARKQSSRLQEIRDELRKLGGTVEIVGAA